MASTNGVGQTLLARSVRPLQWSWNKRGSMTIRRLVRSTPSGPPATSKINALQTLSHTRFNQSSSISKRTGCSAHGWTSRPGWGKTLQEGGPPAVSQSRVFPNFSSPRCRHSPTNRSPTGQSPPNRCFGSSSTGSTGPGVRAPPTFSSSRRCHSLAKSALQPDSSCRSARFALCRSFSRCSVSLVQRIFFVRHLRAAWRFFSRLQECAGWWACRVSGAGGQRLQHAAPPWHTSGGCSTMARALVGAQGALCAQCITCIHPASWVAARGKKLLLQLVQNSWPVSKQAASRGHVPLGGGWVCVLIL